MAEGTMENQALLRRTLVTMGAMIGASVVVVGSLALVALTVVGHAGAAPEAAAHGVDAGLLSAPNARPPRGALPTLPNTTLPRK
jgi:hypothetical protein